MSKKLKNISAIKKMLSGKHHSQTKTTISVPVTEAKTEVRAVGERWFDKNGIEWEQRNGFVIERGKLQDLRAEILLKKMPTNCPNCNKKMKGMLDERFWKTDKRCFDCQLQFEHNLRIEGKFEEYEQNKIRENARAWLKDAETEVNQIIAAITEEIDIANSDASMEKWGGLDKEAIIKKIQEDFNKVREQVLQL